MTAIGHSAELHALAPRAYLERVPASHISWQRLAAAYSEPPRAYHNLGHVVAVARCAAGVAGSLRAPVSVFAAVLFHDAVYEVGPSARPGASNEQRSAQLARECLREVLAPGELDETQRLIEATERHAELAGAATGDLAYFLDCDLSILGAPREAYARYVDNIREEYAHVPSDLFNAGRLRWVQSMLQPTAVDSTAGASARRVFSSDHFEQLLGGSARANLRWEQERRLAEV